ncbi:MAG: hypothetical protein KAS67_01065 [Thermoplasmata archaeon]|nr:hypothetical protein [Thermoplasmata archaeon]
MRDTWVKGNIFQLTLQQVNKRWGTVGIQKLGTSEQQYLPEKGYPAADFYALLSKIRELAEEEGFICRLAEYTIKGDQRWVVKFKGMDPKELFNGFKYQGERYQVGDFDIQDAQEGRVTLKMSLWTDDEKGAGLWAEYYKGRIQGALDLTGRVGTVILTRSGKKNEFLYNISWS